MPPVSLVLHRSPPAADPAAFLPYTRLPRWVPRRAWHVVRAGTVAAYLAECVLLVVRPDVGLLVFWLVVVPLLPLLFLTAPGVWRNLCPLAAANQLPRYAGWSRAAKAPAWLVERGHVIALSLFVAIVTARKLVFDSNGPALAALLLLVVVSAFAGGMLLKGKSGWCSSICPLLPVQRLYGQTPFVVSPNSHCAPCVGCTKNCYDFNPGVAYQADLADPDPSWSAARRLFAAAFPGLVVAYATVPTPPEIRPAAVVLLYAVLVLASAGSFWALEVVARVSSTKLTAVYGAIAFTTFYAFAVPRTLQALREQGVVDLTAAVQPLRVVLALLALVWLARTFRVQQRFRALTAVDAPAARLAPDRARQLADEVGHVVHVEPQGRSLPSAAGSTLLDVVEGAGLPLEAGCRMGVCGADPVQVLDGADQLSATTEDEAVTLRRLGLGPGARLACSAKVLGSCRISLRPEPAAPDPDQVLTQGDPAIRSVVVLGSGIAGATAAEAVRRAHPQCDVHLVGREPHGLYNRMGISRVVYGRTAMQGLFLVQDEWYERNRITAWLNTEARAIDVPGRLVHLGTGEALPWDRLLLATGSSASVPPLEGFGRPGTFVLRDADDAVRLRSYAQQVGARSAVVVGAGLLGIEGAYALCKLGLEVTVLDRGSRLLSALTDERAAALLGDHLAGLGIRVVPGTTARAARGAQPEDRLREVELHDGTRLPADLLLVCAGIRPNADLARAAGIACARGVLVDEMMRTSVPEVFAAGDVVEVDGRVPGLWPVAVAQAEAAAAGIVGTPRRVHAPAAVAILKGVGIDLVSAGRLRPEDGDEVVVVEGPGPHEYVRLVVDASGVLVGAVVLGRPRSSAAVAAAVRREADVRPLLDVLRAGDLDVLAEAAPVTV